MKVVYRQGGQAISREAFTGSGEMPTVRLREMLEAQAPPQANTDATFLAGMSTNGSQFEGQEWLGDYYRQRAEAAGQDTTGKVYLSGLADYPGDPQAWVSGKGDVQRVCEARGWACDGAVKVKAPPLGAPPAPKVDPALVEQYAATAVAQNPELSDRPAEEVREQVAARIAPPW